MSLRKIWSAHHQLYMPIGGRLVPKVRPRLMLRDYLPKGLAAYPATPDKLSYAENAPISLAKMYCNDKYGCCVVAALAHARGVTTGSALVAAGAAPGGELVFSDDDILTMYGWFSGGVFKRNDPTTDQGCDEGTALSVAKTQGFTDGVKLDSFIGVDATNWAEVKLAIFLFECLMTGQGLPESWINPAFPSPGTVLDLGTPVASNGHAMAHPGYDDTLGAGQGRVDTRTWAIGIWETERALAGVASPAGGGELWAFLSPDILARGAARAPNGLDWGTLQADLASLASSPPPPSAPPSAAPAAP